MNAFTIVPEIQRYLNSFWVAFCFNSQLVFPAETWKIYKDILQAGPRTSPLDNSSQGHETAISVLDGHRALVDQFRPVTWLVQVVQRNSA